VDLTGSRDFMLYIFGAVLFCKLVLFPTTAPRYSLRTDLFQLPTLAIFWESRYYNDTSSVLYVSKW